MFERFTDTARECVRLAPEEVRELGHDHIGTEHLLIAVAREPHGLGGRILRDSGADRRGPARRRPSRRRTGVLDRDALATPGHRPRRGPPAGGAELRRGALEGCAGRTDKPRRIPCSPSSKKATQLALRFAVHVGDNFIGSEHVLWGIARVEEGVERASCPSWASRVSTSRPPSGAPAARLRLAPPDLRREVKDGRSAGAGSPPTSGSCAYSRRSRPSSPTRSAARSRSPRTSSASCRRASRGSGVEVGGA